MPIHTHTHLYTGTHAGESALRKHTNSDSWHLGSGEYVTGRFSPLLLAVEEERTSARWRNAVDDDLKKTLSADGKDVYEMNACTGVCLSACVYVYVCAWMYG